MILTRRGSMMSICMVLAFASIISIIGSFDMNVYGQNKDHSSNVTLTEPSKRSKDVNVDVNLNNLKIENVTGTISSLQTDNSSKSWVTTGKWDLKSDPSNAKANSSNVNFNATIDMRGIDNSLPHTHKISHFKLVKTSVDSGDKGTVLTFNGTASIETPFGLKTEVPISIKLIDSGQIILSADAQSGVVEPKWVPKGGIISISIDQKFQEHFGGSPVYGTLKKQ